VHSKTSEVVVHMDGGDARVRIDDGTRIATLVGPSTFIATAAVNV
jgi:hypothetical protein